jgi:hypothetical protein
VGTLGVGRPSSRSLRGRHEQTSSRAGRRRAMDFAGARWPRCVAAPASRARRRVVSWMGLRRRLGGMEPRCSTRASLGDHCAVD